MEYTSNLETLEGFSKALAWRSANRIWAWTILYPLVTVSSTGNCSWLSTRRLVHSQWIVKHAIKRDYTSTLETLGYFCMTLSWCSEHQVGTWAILYPLLKVSSPGNCSSYSTMHHVHSQSIIKSAIWLDYTCTLETLEGLSNALSTHCTQQVEASAILYTLGLESPRYCSW